MTLPLWITVPAFGLASLLELAVGVRYLVWGFRVRAGKAFLLTGKAIHLWWSLLFVPFYLTLPVVWIEWPMALVTVAVSVMFLFYFVPYLKEIRHYRFLIGYNFDPDLAREEVEKALLLENPDVKLEGHRFLTGERELLRGIFDPPSSMYWITAPPSAGKEGGKRVSGLHDALKEIPQKQGARSPWLWRGTFFTAYSIVLAWCALGFIGLSWFPGMAGGRDYELIRVAWEGDEQRVRRLLADGADPNASEAMGRRPLHFAAVCGHVRLVELLLEAGAELDAADHDGSTPLHLAVLNDRDEVVPLLLSRGANLNTKDKNGRTPFDVAKFQNNTALAKLLEKQARQ